MNWFEQLLTGKLDGNLQVKDAFLNYIAEDSVLKFDDIAMSGVASAELEAQGFIEKYKKLGKKLSLKGDGFAIVAYKFAEKVLLEPENVVDYTKVAGRLVELILSTDAVATVRDKEYPINICFRLVGGNVVKTEEYVVNNTTYVVEGSEVDYKMSYIPAMLFHNNALDLPDIPKEIHPMLDQMGSFFDKIPSTWEKVKVLFLNNTSFNSVQDAKTMENKIVANGQSFIDTSDADGKLANALAPVSVGTETLSALQQLTSFFEGKILLYSHQFRDHAHQSQAPSDTSIARYNQQAFEYMQAKLLFRQKQLDKLAVIYADMTGTEITFKINMSEFEQIRIDMLRAARDDVKARAEQSLGIAEKNIAEAESLRKGAQSPEIVATGKVQGE